MIGKRRLKFLGHVVRMDNGRRASQVMSRIIDRKKRRGRLRKNGPERLSTTTLSCLELSWDETNGQNALPHVQICVERY